MKNYYQTLGISPEATDDDIKKAYRSLAMKHHPDRGGDQAKFQEIQEAYGVLSDPQKRAQMHQQQFNPFQNAGGPGGFHFSFGGGGPQDIGDIFRNFHGGNPFEMFGQRPKNRDLRVVVDVDLPSTLSSQKKTISVKHLNDQRQSLTVDIPRGVRTGMQMKYAGHGDNSDKNLPPGDLFIEFRVLPHPKFQIDGIDLVYTAQVDCLDAITGKSIIVDGLDGRQFEWSMPPGTQYGARFVVQGQGIWAVDQPIKGNLVIQANVTIPSGLDREKLNLIKELKTKL